MPISADTGPATAAPTGISTNETERVVRAHPRARLLGHLLLEDGEPQRQVRRDADAREDGDRDQQLHREQQPECERLEHPRDREQARRRQRPARAIPQRHHSAEDRPGRERADEPRPCARARVVLLRDQRPEHGGRCRCAVADPEEDDRRPDPGLAPELVPALPHLGEERLGLDAVGALRDRDAHEQERCCAERGRVDEQRTARAPAATSTPPIAGPRTPRIDRLNPRSAFACCSRVALTIAGIRPCEVGSTKPSASP